jgi:fumarate reductase subunit D
MKRSNEPVFWGLFGAGGMVAALLTPVLILVTGLLVPLGIIPMEKLAFDRVYAFADNIFGAALLFIAICLPLWLTMHRIYHGLHDLGIHAGQVAKTCFYGIALAGSVACATLLLQILI